MVVGAATIDVSRAQCSRRRSQFIVRYVGDVARCTPIYYVRPELAIDPAWLRGESLFRIVASWRQMVWNR